MALWFSIIALTGAGLVMVYSSSYIYAQEKYGDGLHFFKRQFLFVLFGLLSFSVAYRIKLGFLLKRAYLALMGTAALLALSLIPGVSRRAGGAARWIDLGPLHFQPSEVAKIALLLFVAAQLYRKQDEVPNWRTGFLTYFTAALPVYVLLLLQPDFGTVALLLITTLLVLLGTGTHIRYIATVVMALVPVLTTLIAISPYRRARVQAFLDPWMDAAGKGFQVIQSLVAVYSGKWTGVGLGNSKEKLFYLPEAHNDFIFAVVAEELGFLGIALFVTLFLIIVMRGFTVASQSYNLFEKALAIGIACLIGLQAFFNMGVVLGLLPTKGLALPLISYGGTSIVTTLFLLGLLCQLSRDTA